MNWDRVRTESLARLHGSDWVKPPDDTLLGITWKKNEKKKVTQRKNKRALSRNPNDALIGGGLLEGDFSVRSAG
jgi:hypothetical protein